MSKLIISIPGIQNITYLRLDIVIDYEEYLNL